MVGWIDEERRDIFITRPLPSPQYPEVENDDTTIKVVPPTEALEQASSNATEEAVASNLPLVIDEPAPTALNEAAFGTLGEDAPINLEEEELSIVTTEYAPLA